VTVSQFTHKRIVAGPLNSIVVALLFFNAVPVIFTIRFVMLSLVGHEVVDGETIVTGYKVYALLGLALLMRIILRTTE